LKRFALFTVFLSVVLCGVFADDYFSGSRWRGRLNYKDASGVSRNELYELILVKDGGCILTVSGKQDGADVSQDADGFWSFDDRFFRLDVDFPSPALPHLPAVNWTSSYMFDAAKNRFTLLVKPYPDADFVIRTAFVRAGEIKLGGLAE
jgi:hypothetical protein